MVVAQSESGPVGGHHGSSRKRGRPARPRARATAS
jgi:hypothetical protein